MITDLVGHSALLAQAEEQARQVRERISEQVRGRVREHGGTFVDLGIDETFSTFPPAVAAVSCAVAVQQALRGEESLVLRIGVHLGDLGSEASGKSATLVCAAIANTTAPGGIRISAPVFEELRGRLRIEVADLGPISMPDIPQPVHVFAVHPGGGQETGVEPASVQRRLAAVLEADVVSYSRLMATEEDWTVRAMKRNRATFGRHIREHGGRLIDTAGDGVLAEFPSALAAVECGIAVQSKLAEANADTPGRRLVEFRIGVDLGDLRFEGDRVYGSAVNIAARLEALAPPGGLCVSGAVWEQVHYRLGQPFEDLGRQSLKNIPHAVHAHALNLQSSSLSAPGRGRWTIGLIAAGALMLVGAAWFAMRG